MLVLAKNLFKHTLVLLPAIKHVKVPLNLVLPYLLLHQICVFHNCFIRSVSFIIAALLLL